MQRLIFEADANFEPVQSSENMGKICETIWLEGGGKQRGMKRFDEERLQKFQNKTSF